jgi:hypothetical protein
MDLDYSPEHQRFRAELRAFIAEHRDHAPAPRSPVDQRSRGWQALLIDAAMRRARFLVNTAAPGSKPTC